MRRRLLLVVVGLVAFVLAIHDVPLARHLRQVESDRLATKLERDAFILAGRLVEGLEAGTAGDDPAMSALIERYAATEGVRVVVVDSSGTGVLGSDDSVLQEDFTNRPEIERALADGEPQTGERYSETLGTDIYYVAVPVLSGTERLGVVRLSAPSSFVTDKVDNEVRGLLAVALISLGIAAVLALLFARTVTRPLQRLQTATDEIASGDLAARADSDEGPPEVRALAGSFNTMATRLERLVERQRGFAGTASHQLRTPLTALRLRLEQLGSAVADDPVALGAVDDALNETDRLHRMIEGLLALSRAEGATAAPLRLELTDVAAERVEGWEPLAAERGVDLVFEPSEPVEVLCLAGAAEQVLDNLIDNGLEVSPPGSRLQVSVVRTSAGVEVHVVDSGPGLSDDERELAFERFWRGPSAGAGGSGLGLAIVRQLMEAAGGSAELRSAPGGGVDAVACFRPA